MVTGRHIAETAVNSGLLGTLYSVMDCQAFVEVILKRAGMKIPNFRGSNHMWRQLVHDRQPVKGSTPPPGSLAFIVRNDGGEIKRGYHDDMGNATHVAIVIDDSRVMESTTGGVQFGRLARFTDFGLINDVDYNSEEGGGEDAGAGYSEAVTRLLQLVDVLRDNVDGLGDFIREYFRNSKTD